MANLVNRVADRLYPHSGETTADIKFSFEGERRRVTADHMASIVDRALLEVSSGRAKPVSDLSGY